MIPIDLLNLAKELKVDLSTKQSRRERYEPLNKLRRNRDMQKVRKRKMVKASRRRNR